MEIAPENIRPQTSAAKERSVIPSRLPSLDGWRAISIVLVLGAHSAQTSGFPPSLYTPFGWMFDGVLGVRFFFIISGFLITWLMIVETNTAGQVDLKHFYVRRALRILPVYLAFLAVLAMLQWFTAYHQSIASWIGNFTFTTDFIPDNPWTSDHLWSLSVEEQFYLLWPFTFIWCIAKRARLLIVLLVLPLLIAPCCRAFWVILSNPQYCPSFLVKYYPLLTTVFKPILTYHSFFNYFDSLAVGCAGALLLARKQTLVTNFLTTNTLAVAGLALAFLLIPYVLSKLGLFTKVVWPLGHTIQSFGIMTLILQSILLPRWGFYKFLNLTWVCRLGVLSYSIYIWQQIFSSKSESFGWVPVWWMSFPGWLVPVFIVAIISYYGFERPLLRLRNRLRRVSSPRL